MAIDERIARELERAAPAEDVQHLFDGVLKRTRRLRVARRISRVALGLGVLGATAVAVAGLAVAFRGGSGTPVDGFTPSSLPANGAIVFSRPAGPHEGQHLFLVNPDGTGLRQLTFGLVVDEAPDWSPNGTRIVFRRDDLQKRWSGLFVLDVASGTLDRVADGGDPAWSPDGTRIAFDTAQEGRCFIAVVDADGSNEIALTNDRFHCPGDPDWSPDGREIAFEANTPDAEDSWDLYTIRPD